jgi:predicted transcriptional regulator
MIVQGTREGLDAARELLGNPDNTVSSIARLLGVSRATIYKYVPEVRAAALPDACTRHELPAPPPPVSQRI